MLLSFLLNIFFHGSLKKIKFDNIAFFLLLYWLLSLCSYFYIVDIHYFVYAMKVATFSLTGYFLALNIFDNKNNIKYFLYSACLTVFILSTQLVYKFYQMGFSTKFFFERNTIQILVGPLATVSAILVFLIPIVTAFYFYENENKRWNPYIILIFLFGIFAVFLTLSKGALASLAIALFIIFAKIKPSRPLMIILGAWFLLISFIVLNPFLSGLLDRIMTTFADKNTKYRFLEYQTGWEIVKNHPLIGVGAGQQLHYFKELLKFDNAQLVNNYFFQSLIDLGIIGLGICITLFSSIVDRVIAVYKNVSLNRILVVGFIASFVCAFFNGLVEVTIFALPYAIVFWITLGVFNNIKKYV